MERINPLPDQLQVLSIKQGETVSFRGKLYTVVRRTTLASGEPALVLARDGEQFVIGAGRFFSEKQKPQG